LRARPRRREELPLIDSRRDDERLSRRRGDPRAEPRDLAVRAGGERVERLLERRVAEREGRPPERELADVGLVREEREVVEVEEGGEEPVAARARAPEERVPQAARPRGALPAVARLRGGERVAVLGAPAREELARLAHVGVLGVALRHAREGPAELLLARGEA